VAHDSLLLLQALGPLKEHPNERLADGLLADRPFQQAVERGRYGFTTAILALAHLEVPIARDVAEVPSHGAVREGEALRGELFDQLSERCPSSETVPSDLLLKVQGQAAPKAASGLDFRSRDGIGNFAHWGSTSGRRSGSSPSTTDRDDGNHRERH